VEYDDDITVIENLENNANDNWLVENELQHMYDAYNQKELLRTMMPK